MRKVYSVSKGNITEHEVIKETAKSYRVAFKNIEGSTLLPKREPSSYAEGVRYYERMVTTEDKEKAEFFAKRQKVTYQLYLYTELMRVSGRPHVDVEAICGALHDVGAQLATVECNDNEVRIIARVNHHCTGVSCHFDLNKVEDFITFVDSEVNKLCRQIKRCYLS